MPKLFMVSGLTVRSGEPHMLVVAGTAEEAERKMLEPEDNCYILNAFAHEITEIDGYKIVFKKGKKIALIKGGDANATDHTG
jgi:hypothetical protein